MFAVTIEGDRVPLANLSTRIPSSLPSRYLQGNSMADRNSTDLRLESAGGLDARFCEAMDAAPVMIWVSGKDKGCVWFNRPWLNFTGRSMAQELGNGWTDGVHPDDFACWLEIYIGHFEARKEFRMQYRLRRNDGAYHWFDDVGIPRYARDGIFLGYIGSCTDITHLKAPRPHSARASFACALHLKRRRWGHLRSIWLRAKPSSTNRGPFAWPPRQHATCFGRRVAQASTV